MKKTAHFLGIIALAAVIGFGVAGCKSPIDDPAHTHTWGAWQETTVPTCTTAGIQTRTCTVCGAADTQTQEGTAALGHDWNAAKEVISTVSETTDSVKAITCKRDKTHTKDEEVNEYATGTAGLAYTLITTGDYADTYSVSKGTFDGAVLHIPAYHRPTTDDDYIPVTDIRGFYGWIEKPNTTLTAVTFATQNQLRSIGIDAFASCTSLTSIMVDANNSNYASEGGILYNKDKTTLISYPSATGSFTIPAITSIDNYAFRGCTDLASVTIPASVTSIGRDAFAHCISLTSINIPEGVTTIGRTTFWNCTSLASITIPASVTTMDSSAFYDWTAEQTINVPFANADATPAGWDTGWKFYCNAVIKYWNGTTWE